MNNFHCVSQSSVTMFHSSGNFEAKIQLEAANKKEENPARYTDKTERSVGTPDVVCSSVKQFTCKNTKMIKMI